MIVFGEKKSCFGQCASRDLAIPCEATSPESPQSPALLLGAWL